MLNFLKKKILKKKKTEYIIKIAFNNYKDFEKIEERLKSLLDEVNVKVAVA